MFETLRAYPPDINTRLTILAQLKGPLAESNAQKAKELLSLIDRETDLLKR